ncbi:4-hydroxy-tetrahydrodipicolinate synthase [Halobiforma haloterrestris]|uniref:4-hydroxy-tetrahydrodipicolinate synthase n=1 Tax=Natronobacterium haloterrestre TaxID=148448 RepID=A0A1I1E8A0_NATHA|nr:4-hydroxy-tetrahydrodipicolinate synthase [Halobiforma haloterrestris]SFB83287.1 4-hydroxy-tetrahydrodipicolinate synthase [Halobiforma haloterrestris]
MNLRLRRALEGITCPLVTPMDADGDLDEDALADLVDHLLAGGIDGLFPCGTTGEFASLAPAERRRVVEIVVDRADGEVPVLAGAAATSVSETVDYVDEAADVGADAAVVVPPYFHPSNDPDGVRQFFDRVADETSLPLLLYNIPACTGEPIPLEVVETLAERESCVGLKDSSGDLEYFLSARERTPEEFLLLQGYDALLVPALRTGGDGGINALSNVAPEAYAELSETAGTERGRRLQSAVSGLFEACDEYGFAPVTKAALAYRGVIPNDAVRPPLVPVPDDDRSRIETAVDTLLEA